MRRLLVPLAAAALLVAACGTAEPAPTAATPGGQATGADVLFQPSADVTRAAADLGAPVAVLAGGLNNAGFNLLRTRPPAGNLVFSPASIGHALLMARAAADPATRSAIDVGFGLPEGIAAHRAWNAVAQAIAAGAAAADDVTMTIADRIWPRRDVTPAQDWIDLLAAQHGAQVEALDFAGDPNGSRETINDWVSQQTAGLIPELLPGGFLDANTVLILTDAMYLAARWEEPFGKYQDVAAPFTRLDGSTVQVDFMRQPELIDHRGSGDGFVAAEIPYSGGALSMLVIVPEPGRFEEIRDRIDQDFLDDVDATFGAGPYELLLPRWSTTTALNLLPWLTAMGAAPGSYPSISPEAFLDGAIHGADITVDEWGTVAAAATALGFDETAAAPPDLTIAVDHPYLYVIRDRSTGIVLFAGQVTDPTA
jgi:serpin B